MTNLRKYQISYQKCCHTSMKELKKSICTAILLLMIPCFAFAQTTKRDIKLDFTNTPITKIIESIEKQSGYSFFYNSDINTSQKTSIKMTSNDINQIVSTLLKSTSIDYRITEKRIVLFLKKTADEQKKGLYRHRSNKRCIRSGDRRLYRYQKRTGNDYFDRW